MYQDATWYGGHIVLDGDPAPPRKGTAAPYVAAHIYCDQTVAHLSSSATAELLYKMSAVRHLRTLVNVRIWATHDEYLMVFITVQNYSRNRLESMQ